MSNVKIDELSNLLTDYMSNYSEEVTTEIKKGIDSISEEVNEEIKNHVTFKEPTGKYVKAFRVKTSYEDSYNKRNTWYVTNGQYRLTHLLENGHALRNGGRAKAYPHIKFGEELAQRRMEEMAKEAVENANKL